MSLSTCKGCGDDIVWAKTKTSKWMPLNTTHVIMFVLNEDGTTTAVRAHKCHWDTCKDADLFRGGMEEMRTLGQTITDQ